MNKYDIVIINKVSGERISFYDFKANHEQVYIDAETLVVLTYSSDFGFHVRKDLEIKIVKRGKSK